MQSQKLNQIRRLQDQLLDQAYDLPIQLPFQDSYYYGLWLSQHYYYINHTTRLLAAGAKRFEPSNKLHTRYLKHAAEEQHHEMLIVKDLKNLNFDISDFPEFPITAQMYQSQYYLIENRSPSALLGYILFLEGISCKVGPQIYQMTKKNYGESASNFIRTHADQDDAHLREAQKILEIVPEGDLDAVEWSLRQTAVIYAGVLDEVSKAYFQAAASHSKKAA